MKKSFCCLIKGYILTADEKNRTIENLFNLGKSQKRLKVGLKVQFNKTLKFGYYNFLIWRHQIWATGYMKFLSALNMKACLNLHARHLPVIISGKIEITSSWWAFRILTSGSIWWKWLNIHRTKLNQLLLPEFNLNILPYA